MFEINLEGLDEVLDSLDKLRQKSRDIDRTDKLSLGELFSDNFMKKYTDYDSIEKMFENSDFKIESQGDFEKIPDQEWDEYVRETTNFNNWEEMLSKAREEWIAKKLGL